MLPEYKFTDKFTDKFICYCFGKKSSPAPTPPPPSAGVIDTGKALPDPSQAYRYQGTPPAENMTGRMGGGLLLDAAARERGRTSLGGT